MKKDHFLSFSVILLMLSFFGCISNAQYKVYDVWQDSIPGAISAESQEIVNTKADGSRRLSGVTRPELWLFKAKGDKPKPTVIVCPGGGYAKLAFEHEGIQVAKWLNKRGINALVLKYRLPNSQYMTNTSIGPLMDAQQAISYVRKKAKKFEADPNKIGIMGFSAGGHLAGSASTMCETPVVPGLTTAEVRPDFSILVYPVTSMEADICHKGSRDNLLGKEHSAEMVKQFSLYNRVTKNTPPTFIVHAKDDTSVPIANTERYIDALVANNISYSKFLLEKGGHGFGMRKGSTYVWLDHLEEWLIDQNLQKEKKK